MHDHGGGISLIELIGFGLLLLVTVYVIAAGRASTRGGWPAYRTILWIAGCLVAALSVQVASARHDDFAAHALALVGLGMLAPILLMLAAPLTLALWSLSVVPGRRLYRILRSWPVRFVSAPVTAGVLSLAGFWLLYAGELYARIHTNGILFAIMHVHIFVSGCLFASAITGPDPHAHRASFPTRAVVLCAVIAGHSILSIFLFARPPAGVPLAEAHAGIIALGYGGDLVLLALAVVFGAAWYREAAHRRSRSADATLSTADELPPAPSRP